MVEEPSSQQEDHDRFDAILVEAVGAAHVALTEDQRPRMWEHFRLVVETNRRFNLTRITSAADAAVKHYADSLTLLAAPWIDAGRPLRVLDVGTGAGFPAVPLAIVRPDWRFTAIDGTAKKVRFVAEAVGRLRLANVEARHARAADLARSSRERFDLVLLRAVSRIAAGLDEVHRLVTPGGSVVFYKTARIEPAELADAGKTARRLNLRETEPFDITLPSPAGPLPRRLMRYDKPDPW